MSKKKQLRVFKELDMDTVHNHLMIMGDVTANCASCGELGLDPYSIGVCPQCSTPFQFIASRRLESHPGERFQLASKIQEKRPDLTLIDYQDYQKLMGKKKAHDFFNNL